MGTRDPSVKVEGQAESTKGENKLGSEIGVRQTLLLFCGFQTLVAPLWPESRGYILAVRPVTPWGWGQVLQ